MSAEFSTRCPVCEGNVLGIDPEVFWGVTRNLTTISWRAAPNVAARPPRLRESSLPDFSGNQGMAVWH